MSPVSGVRKIEAMNADTGLKDSELLTAPFALLTPDLKTPDS